MDLFGLIAMFWRDKLLAGAIIACGILATALYVFLAPEWFTARIVIAETKSNLQSGFPGELGGLASLVGVDLESNDSAEAKTVLMSRELAREFIQDHQLVPVFFADQWDRDAETWTADDPEDWPDVRDAVDYFEDNVRQLREEGAAGISTLYISWKDAGLAAAWADELVRRVNDSMRTRALEEAQRNVDYLQDKLTTTTQLTLQQSIGSVLESELQKLLIAQGNEEFAFRVLDSPEVPKYPSKPKKLLLIAAAAVFSFVLAFIVVILRQIYHDRGLRYPLT
jgi:uncharacterized protein involved in exopolysaccharide biosynthesis